MPSLLSKKSALLALLIGVATCEDTEEYYSFSDQSDSSSESIKLHKIEPGPFTYSSETITKNFEKVLEGHYSLNEIFQVYPVWSTLKNAKTYDPYGPFQSDLYNHILTFFIKVLKRTKSQYSDPLHINSLFRHMSDAQLEALFYGAHGKSPICAVILGHHNEVQIFNYFNKRIKIDLLFSCPVKIRRFRSFLFRDFKESSIWNENDLKRFGLTSNAMEIASFSFIPEGDRTKEHIQTEYEELLLKANKIERNLFQENVLFDGSILTLAKVQRYFEVDRRTCKVVDFMGNSPLHVSLLHPDLEIILYYLKSSKCKHSLKHYNYEGNNPLMFLLDNLPFTGELPKRDYFADAKPGSHESTSWPEGLSLTEFNSQAKPGVQDFTHSTAYYLVKRMLPKSKGQFNIKNKYGENTYDLALKTKSLPIIHMIFSHDTPSQEEMEMWAEKALKMKNYELAAYFFYVHLEKDFERVLPRYIPYLADAYTSMIPSPFVKNYVEFFEGKNNLNNYMALSLLNENASEVINKDVLDRMEGAIADNDLNTATLLQFFISKNVSVRTEDIFRKKLENFILKCKKFQKRAMLWIIQEMGIVAKVEGREDILTTWKEFDAASIKDLSEKSKDLSITYSGLYDVNKWIPQELKKGISPVVIFNHLVRPMLEKNISHRELLATLVQAGLNPNINQASGRSAFRDAVEFDGEFEVYIKAGINKSYSPVFSSQFGEDVFSAIHSYDKRSPLTLIALLKSGVKLDAPNKWVGTVSKDLLYLFKELKQHRYCPILRKYFLDNNILTHKFNNDVNNELQCSTLSKD